MKMDRTLVLLYCISYITAWLCGASMLHWLCTLAVHRLWSSLVETLMYYKYPQPIFSEYVLRLFTLLLYSHCVPTIHGPLIGDMH